MLTQAGKKMLKNYLDLEAGKQPEGRWPDFYSKKLTDVFVGDYPAKAMILSPGDGGAKAVAERLEKDGLAIVRWNTERLVIITDAGRAAMAASN